MSSKSRLSKSVSVTKPMDSDPLPEVEPVEETAPELETEMAEPAPETEPMETETRTPTSKRLEKVRERMDKHDKRRNEVMGPNNTVRA